MTNELTRKIVRTGRGSLGLTIPSQLAQMCGLVAGEVMAFEYLGPGEFRIKKASEDPVKT